MPSIYTRRQKSILIEANCTDPSCSMIRAQSLDQPPGCLYPMAESTTHFAPTPTGYAEARRAWSTLSDEMRNEARRSFISCMIEQFDNPQRAEILQMRDRDFIEPDPDTLTPVTHQHPHY